MACMVGCHKPADKWEIIAMNQSTAPCEISMDIGPGAGVNAPDLAGGERRLLLTGSTNLVIRTLKVVWSRKQQVFTPGVEVPLGKSYDIDVDTDGSVVTSIK